jgi:hypothetical protein
MLSSCDLLPVPSTLQLLQDTRSAALSTDSVFTDNVCTDNVCTDNAPAEVAEQVGASAAGDGHVGERHGVLRLEVQTEYEEGN